MNIVFNKCIFAYLCLFYSSIKYVHEFQSIFVNFRFTDIFVKIFTDISIKSKYRYIRKYRYFVSCSVLRGLLWEVIKLGKVGSIHPYKYICNQESKIRD